MATEDDILIEIAALETRIGSMAGVSSTSFGDQSVSFDLRGASERLAYLQRQLLTARGTPSNVRYAATSKGV